jgi:hypothetical protein
MVADGGTVTGIEFVTDNSKGAALGVSVGIFEGFLLGLRVMGDKVGTFVVGNLKKKI